MQQQGRFILQPSIRPRSSGTYLPEQPVDLAEQGAGVGSVKVKGLAALLGLLQLLHQLPHLPACIMLHNAGGSPRAGHGATAPGRSCHLPLKLTPWMPGNASTAAASSASDKLVFHVCGACASGCSCALQGAAHWQSSESW